MHAIAGWWFVVTALLNLYQFVRYEVRAHRADNERVSLALEGMAISYFLGTLAAAFLASLAFDDPGLANDWWAAVAGGALLVASVACAEMCRWQLRRHIQAAAS